MIHTVGREFLVSNIENNEFSYARVLDRRLNTGHFKLDLRFINERAKVAVLVETKQRFNVRNDKAQLFDYVNLEKELNPDYDIIAILANTSNDAVSVWKIDEGGESELDDTILKSMEDYVSYFEPQNINDKNAVLENTAKLNTMLLDFGIDERLRSQFVGTCLLALKEGLKYRGITTAQINAGIKSILASMLEGSLERAEKLLVLDKVILEDANVINLRSEDYQKLLSFIRYNILPYINHSTAEGQDILSYFFTTFNKYVDKGNKNQAFTPNHIAHFMCKVSKLHSGSIILDPTCGSGTFLVQAMAMMLNACETLADKKHVREHQLFGIEKAANVYGLATTNMLIHGDGNSNIISASCFDKADWITRAGANIILMNPPYNASKNEVPRDFANTFGNSKTDPTKGLYFVKYIANLVGSGRLVTLLPMQCAIKTDGIIADYKRDILNKHTLDAVFSLPSEIFYPGASAVACCMVFDLGIPHRESNRETFFGYFKDDGFKKRKGVGRVDVSDAWSEIERSWLDLYNHRSNQVGHSVTANVTATDEWCAEAYMETDYSTLTESDFISKIKDFLSYKVKYE